MPYECIHKFENKMLLLLFNNCRVLDCGNHYCQDVCHPEACVECLLKPLLVSHCPCGKTPLCDLLGELDVRKSCMDPVPTCKTTCGKTLPCSPTEGKLSSIINNKPSWPRWLYKWAYL